MSALTLLSPEPKFAFRGGLRVPTESRILEKILKFAQQFSRPRQSLENRDKVWKKWQKAFEFFFFQSYSKCLSDIFLRLGQTICLQHTTKKALFLRFLRCLLITYFVTVSLEKNYCP